MPPSRPITPVIPPYPNKSPGGTAHPVIPPNPAANNVASNLAIPSWYTGAAARPPSRGSRGRHSRSQSQSGQTPYRQPGGLHPIISPDDPGGVSDDWIGFGPGGANPYANLSPYATHPAMGYVAPNFGMPPPGTAFSAPHNLPPGTPWNAWPPAAIPTSYSAFQQPLPGGHPNFGHPPLLNVNTNFPPGFGGFGGGMGFGPSSHPGTPWMGGGYVPLTPGESLATQLPDPVTGLNRPKMDVQVDTRWMVGEHYGPVLTKIQILKLRCAPKLNPLLGPPPEDPATRDFLEWNMLFSSSHVHRSSDPQTRSWSNGRAQPATFPRVASLKIASRLFPWVLEVRASSPSVGVTCADVIDTLSDFMHEHVPKNAYDALTPTQRERVHSAYYHNRSRAVGDDVPGGRLGEGIKRCDWLGRHTMFDGIESDANFVRNTLGFEFSDRRSGSIVPCVFVLRTASRGGVTEEEREANEERGQDASTITSDSDD